MIKHSRKVLEVLKPIAGKTFVCGDIHGSFDLLERVLKQISFNKDEDRLICVGDIIDRGPESINALHYLSQAWFYSVLGNHERMLLETLEHVPHVKSNWYNNGGRWFELVDAKQVKDEWYAAISELPLAIEVATHAGNVGIVHASVPDGMSWPDFIKKLKQGDWQSYGYATWGRQKKGTPDIEIKGIERVYAGHIVLSEMRQTQNFFQIDTGAFLRTANTKLTVIEIGCKNYCSTANS